MGIMDFIKQGTQEMMIARPDAAKQHIVYKHPEQTIPMFSQLTVDADEAAVFFRDGSLVGVLRTAGAGQRHTLSTGNIPFLSNLVDSFTGGNIFITDLYFVTMRPFRGARFGGSIPPIKDPELEITLTPRIFGEYAWQITRPDAFIVQYLGLGGQQSNEQVERWITTKFMNAVKRSLPQFIIRQKVEVQHLAAYHDEIGQMFMQRCEDLSEIGVQFLELGDFSINFDDDDQKRLEEAQARYADLKVKKRAKDELGGGNYMAYAAGEAMLGAGTGMAQGGGGEGGGGGAMQGGAGMGMGFAMANMFANQMHPGQMQPGYPPQQPGYPPQQQGYPPQQQGGYPPQGHPPAGAAPAAAAGAAWGGATQPGAAAQVVTCPGCAAQVPPGKFCAECGTSLAPAGPRPCPSCSAMVAPGAKFCANCGTRQG
ncbi:MAG: SPFH domain-containing protein [Sandaracinaceae bacterium]